MATLTERLSTFLYHPCNRSDISSATLIISKNNLIPHLYTTNIRTLY